MSIRRDGIAVGRDVRNRPFIHTCNGPYIVFTCKVTSKNGKILYCPLFSHSGKNTCIGSFASACRKTDDSMTTPVKGPLVTCIAADGFVIFQDTGINITLKCVIIVSRIRIFVNEILNALKLIRPIDPNVHEPIGLVIS